MNITIYHNPRCSKSRQSLELLTAANISPTVVEYLNEPPDAATILQLATWLDMRVSELLRRGEAEFKDATDLPDLTDDAALAAWITRNPKTLQRPIIVNMDQARAVIGRPPENLLPLVEQ
jgi:arsenate reductase